MANQERTRGRTWERIRQRVLDADPLCRMCDAAGLVTAAQEVDHIVPLHRGGTDDPDNLQGLCKPCHAIKTAEDMGWAREATGLDGWPEAGEGRR